MTVDNTVNTLSATPSDSQVADTASTGPDAEGPPPLTFAEWSRLNPNTPITVPAPPDVSVSASTYRNDLYDYHRDVLQHGRDSYGQRFVDTSPESKPTPLPEHREYKVIEGKLTQIRREDSFKIGIEGSGWEEPPYTCLVNTDPAVPPYNRLVNATIDFWHSRAPIFQFGPKVSASAFSTVRGIFDLQRRHSVQHWPGSGPDAEFYEPSTNEKRTSSGADFDAWNANPGKHESCPLLRYTDRSVRGLLAIARREAGAVRRQIFAAFLSSLDHYEVLNEPHLAPKFHRAAKLARSAPQAIKNAFTVEELIEARKGLNYSSWVRYGGSYRNRPLGQPVGPVSSEGGGANTEGDDGGWSVARDKDGAVVFDYADIRPILNVSPADAEKELKNLFKPFYPAKAMLNNYIAFGRRRVVAVFSPEKSSPDRPDFKTTHHRLRTVPAPFTEQEQWRSRRDPTLETDIEKVADFDEPEEEMPLELEQDTVETPEEIDIWVDLSTLNHENYDWIIGMGIRGRWAEIKINDNETFWIAKMKDYVLPNFWQATEAELAEEQSGPPSPYTDEFLGDLCTKFSPPKFTIRNSPKQTPEKTATELADAENAAQAM
ncbi:uncharacterized protein LOC62_01G000415 [Vanrija pseudolonga]|uniref:Uncharacterized protein n=1 Tax=Vanrija pseudolonga TaxID=143232 RepID=A0AAF1BF31_9TREE|nr:hypothetical protein LOC62_01G000415 [Vanrija pseudolonga]